MADFSRYKRTSDKVEDRRGESEGRAHQSQKTWDDLRDKYQKRMSDSGGLKDKPTTPLNANRPSFRKRNRNSDYDG